MIMDADGTLSRAEMIEADASEEPYGESVDDPTDVSIFGPSTLQEIFVKSLNRSNPDVARQLVLLTHLSNKKRYGFRDILEYLDAKHQCQYAIPDKTRTEKATCWLCGFTIKQVGDALIYRGKPCWTDAKALATAENAPECEHLIPVSAAVMFFGVVASAADVKPAGAREYYSANYEWSHKVCNGLKDHSLFVNLRNAAGDLICCPTINPEYITSFLTKLHEKSPDIKLLASENPNGWLASRQDAISRRLDVLLQLINKSYKINLLLGTDNVLGGVSSFYNKLIESLKANPLGKMSETQKLSNGELLDLIYSQDSLYRRMQVDAATADAASGLVSLSKGARRKTLKRKNNGKFIPSRKRRGKKGRTRRNP